MERRGKELGTLSAGQRIVAAAAAAIVSTSLVAALLWGVHIASPASWLVPTAQLMELAADCERRLDRGAREGCMRRVVAAYRDIEHHAVQMVQR